MLTINDAIFSDDFHDDLEIVKRHQIQKTYQGAFLWLFMIQT